MGPCDRVQAAPSGARREHSYLPDGPPRIPRQAALRQARGARARGPARHLGRRGGRGRRGARLPRGDQGPGADRRARQGRRHQARRTTAPRPRRTPRRSSGWTSAGSPCTSSTSSRPPTSPRSTTPRSCSTAAPRSRWRCSRAWAAWTSRRSPRRTPTAMVKLHVDPLIGFQDFHGRRLAFDAGIAADVIRPVGAMLAQALRDVRGRGRDARRGQPAARDGVARRGGARREGHARRQRALPPPRLGRVPEHLGRGPAGADGQGARPHLRVARRQHRDPRQRRRPRDVHARRGGPGRRQAGELPRRRRRLQGRGDHERRGGHPLQPAGHGRALQHLRRHHPLRRGGARADRGVRPDRAHRPVRGPARRHERRGGPRACWPRRTCPNVHTESTMLDAANRVVELAG